MVGMDVSVLQVVSGLRMFLPGGLICGTFTPLLAGLTPFVLHTGLDALFQRLGRSTGLPRADQFRTDVKEEVAIPPLPIRDETHVPGLFNHLTEGLDRLLKQALFAFSTVQFPQEAARPIL
jgi:hypothetical protein